MGKTLGRVHVRVKFNSFLKKFFFFKFGPSITETDSEIGVAVKVSGSTVVNFVSIVLLEMYVLV